MSLSRSLAIFRHENRLLRQQWLSMTQLLFIPIIMMTFLKSVSRFALVDQGYSDANGSEQVVPGFALMFAFFLCGSVAFSIFIEHGYGTWERLRASQARPAEIMLGKAISPLMTVVLQQAALMAYGVVVLGMQITGSPIALLAVAAAFGMPLIGYGMLLAGWCRRSQQVQLSSSLIAMLFAGLGGAVIPAEGLPQWAQGIAWLTPTYWGMQGYRAVILDGAGLATVATPIAVLVVMGLVVGAVGLARFRFEETKIVMG